MGVGGGVHKEASLGSCKEGKGRLRGVSSLPLEVFEQKWSRP